MFNKLYQKTRLDYLFISDKIGISGDIYRKYEPFILHHKSPQLNLSDKFIKVHCNYADIERSETLSVT